MSGLASGVSQRPVASEDIFRRFETLRIERRAETPAEREQILRTLRDEFSLPESTFERIRQGFERREDPAQLFRSIFAAAAAPAPKLTRPAENAATGVSLRQGVLSRARQAV